jgi:hypothetical protein
LALIPGLAGHPDQAKGRETFVVGQPVIYKRDAIIVLGGFLFAAAIIVVLRIVLWVFAG